MPLYPKSWLLSVVTALALQKRTVGWWILAVTVWNTVLAFLSRRFKEVGHSGWSMSWGGRWNHLGVHHSRRSTFCMHRQQASCGAQSTGMRLYLHWIEVGVWISYKGVGGAVDTETAGRCYSLLLAGAFRRTLGLPCSSFCPVCKRALTQG